MSRKPKSFRGRAFFNLITEEWTVSQKTNGPANCTVYLDGTRRPLPKRVVRLIRLLPRLEHMAKAMVTSRVHAASWFDAEEFHQILNVAKLFRKEQS